MNDNRAWTGEENGAFAVLSEAHVILDSIIGKDARPIAARLADVATDRAHIAALEAENAALKAERDAYRSQFWDKALPDLVEMRKQRDAAYAERDAKHAAFNVMDGCYKQAVAERDSETRWAHHYFTAWQTARQSRARLVGLVRHLRARFSATAPDSAFVKRITDERDSETRWAHYYFTAWQTARQSRARLVRLVRALPVRWSYQTSEELSMAWNDLVVARAWAAAWKRAAQWWRGAVHYMALGGHVNYGKASRKRRAAAEAAEAMERR